MSLHTKQKLKITVFLLFFSAMTLSAVGKGELMELTIKATLAYLNRLGLAFSEGYRYDFSSFTSGLSQGVIFGDFASVVEIDGRLFPLEWVPRSGMISNMLYLGAFSDVGYMLPRRHTAKDGLTSVTLGAAVGFLFFETDFSFKIGWNSHKNFVWEFSVLTNFLQW